MRGRRRERPGNSSRGIESISSAKSASGRRRKKFRQSAVDAQLRAAASALKAMRHSSEYIPLLPVSAIRHQADNSASSISRTPCRAMEDGYRCDPRVAISFNDDILKQGCAFTPI
jgi:hypothetical protein